MARTKAIFGWLAWLLVPVAVPLVAGLLSEPARRSVEEIQRPIRDLLEWDRLGDIDLSTTDWDAFECVPLADPALESIRIRAVKAGPPNVDRAVLEGLLKELKAIKS